MIGDTPDSDIAGAHRAGITGVLISQEDAQYASARDDSVADAVIPDLTGLFDPGVITSRKARR
jgi:FMN phosphatase YigB (HAD superfamily)